VKTLLSKEEGGSSKYGTLAFRQLGDAWLVGIKAARGNVANEFGNIVGFGRATPRFQFDDTLSVQKRKKTAALVKSGGILTIDTVLIPYQPDWFRRWGWIAVVAIMGACGVLCVALLVYKLYNGRKEAQYEALENEEN